MLAQSEQTNKEEEEIEKDETGQNEVNNSTNQLVNLDDDSSDDDNETDDTLFMHQSEQTIQSSDKQDTILRLKRYAKIGKLLFAHIVMIHVCIICIRMSLNHYQNCLDMVDTIKQLMIY